MTTKCLKIETEHIRVEQMYIFKLHKRGQSNKIRRGAKTPRKFTKIYYQGM